jgi:hypothetical protein
MQGRAVTIESMSYRPEEFFLEEEIRDRTPSG